MFSVVILSYSNILISPVLRLQSLTFEVRCFGVLLDFNRFQVILNLSISTDLHRHPASELNEITTLTPSRINIPYITTLDVHHRVISGVSEVNGLNLKRNLS